MRWASITAAVLTCSCAAGHFQLPRLTAATSTETAIGHVELKHEPGVVSDANQTLIAVRRAAPYLEPWGMLKAPVTINLLASHAELEHVIRRRGYPWLRAWGQYDDILLQTPSSWNGTDAELTELLAHELTHCLMYQRAATPSDWASKPIPLWFREGMASWTSQQSKRWMSLDELQTVYAEGATSDPILHAEDLYQSRSPVVYAAAHHAFTFLLETHGGVSTVSAMLDAMGRGASFPEAFKRTVGIDEATFIASFHRHVVSPGPRGDAKLKP